jgi:hypothetical protein
LLKKAIYCVSLILVLAAYIQVRLTPQDFGSLASALLSNLDKHDFFSGL